ncbi:MAG: GerMN domain-containing protein [Blautia sp.]|nr:GerMN domain-containing protein [Blautia sp.]
MECFIKISDYFEKPGHSFICFLLASILMLGSVLSFFAVPAAAGQEEEEGYFFYYLTHDEDDLEKSSYSPARISQEAMVQELIQKLNDREKHGDGHSLFPAEVQITSYTLSDSVLELDLTAAYSNMELTRELLTRYGLVKTFTQVPGISKVLIRSGGRGITDRDENPLGPMNETNFIEWKRNSIDAYRYDSFTLYFADSDGSALVPETRSVYYLRSVPISYIMMEQLSNGPIEKNHYPTIPSNTVVNEIRILDQVAHVDFSKSFIDSSLPLPSDIIIGSVTATLCTLPNVREVRITVNGEEKASMRDGTSLYQYFKTDNALIEK